MTTMPYRISIIIITSDEIIMRPTVKTEAPEIGGKTLWCLCSSRKNNQTDWISKRIFRSLHDNAAVVYCRYKTKMMTGFKWRLDAEKRHGNLTVRPDHFPSFDIMYYGKIMKRLTGTTSRNNFSLTVKSNTFAFISAYSRCCSECSNIFK